MKWFIQIAGNNPVGTSPDVDRCFGVAYDKRRAEVSILLQTKSKEIRGRSPGNYYDNVLIVIDTSGDLHRAAAITWSSDV